MSTGRSPQVILAGNFSVQERKNDIIPRAIDFYPFPFCGCACCCDVKDRSSIGKSLQVRQNTFVSVFLVTVEIPRYSRDLREFLKKTFLPPPPCHAPEQIKGILQAVSIFSAASRPSALTESSRILNFCIFPVTPIGKSLTNIT